MLIYLEGATKNEVASGGDTKKRVLTAFNHCSINHVTENRICHTDRFSADAWTAMTGIRSAGKSFNRIDPIKRLD